MFLINQSFKQCNYPYDTYVPDTLKVKNVRFLAAESKTFAVVDVVLAQIQEMVDQKKVSPLDVHSYEIQVDIDRNLFGYNTHNAQTNNEMLEFRQILLNCLQNRPGLTEKNLQQTMQEIIDESTQVERFSNEENEFPLDDEKDNVSRKEEEIPLSQEDEIPLSQEDEIPLSQEEASSYDEIFMLEF